MRKYVPAPGDDAPTADYDQPRAVIAEAVGRQVEFDLLPDDWQTRVKGKMINWLNKGQAEWTRTLRQVETEVQLFDKQKMHSEKKRKEREEESLEDERKEKLRKKLRKKKW